MTETYTQYSLQHPVTKEFWDGYRSFSPGPTHWKRRKVAVERMFLYMTEAKGNVLELLSETVTIVSNGAEEMPFTSEQARLAHRFRTKFIDNLPPRGSKLVEDYYTSLRMFLLSHPSSMEYQYMVCGIDAKPSILAEVTQRFHGNTNVRFTGRNAFIKKHADLLIFKFMELEPSAVFDLFAMERMDVSDEKTLAQRIDERAKALGR